METGRQDRVPTRPTVLVIDDHDQLRQTLTEAVEALGFAAEEACDGDEALPLLQTRHYEAVICDLVMPHMMGDQLFHACQECDAENARRFIFISGAARGNPSCRAASQSGQPYLRKPCEVSDILYAITAVSVAAADS